VLDYVAGVGLQTYLLPEVTRGLVTLLEVRALVPRELIAYPRRYEAAAEAHAREQSDKFGTYREANYAPPRGW